MYFRQLNIVLITGLILLGLNGSTYAGEKLGPNPKDVQEVLDKALNFLKTRQTKDGGFAPKIAGPGVSALIAAGLIRNGVSPKEPVVERTLQFLEKNVKADGGVYEKGLANYTTSVAVMAFKEANTGGRYDAVLKNAVKFLKGLQDDSDPKAKNSGGFTYDGNKKKNPDASNTAYTVEALLAAGLDKDDPAVKNALKFLSRCQNIKNPEFNDQPFAMKVIKDDEGGFVYVPDPDDKRHATTAGGLRSLGGMTYGGLKSFLYAGVGKDDPRVKAAVNWVRRHYTLEENPGMKQSGLYYYYHTFGKAMTAWGEDRFADEAGKKHDWRLELFEALKKRQKDDGSWSNAGDKTFGEASPELATAFAILSLSYCQVSKR